MIPEPRIPFFRLGVLLASLALSVPGHAWQSSIDCRFPASSEYVGLATPGAPGLLELTLEGAPIVKGPYRLVVENGRPNAHGILLLSLEEDPRYVAEWGATVYPAFPFLIEPFVLDDRGKSPRLLSQAPVHPSLCSLTFLSQAAAADPAARGGVSFSKALRTGFGLTGTKMLLAPLTEFPIGRNALDGAVEDLNGDQIPDVVVNALLPGGSSGDAIQVLLGNGDGTFEPTRTFPAGANHPGRFACGDVDGDRVVDVVSSSGNGQLLFGAGDGSFGPPVALEVEHADGVAIGDVNGDGIPDVLFTNQIRGDELKVLIGVGDGTFEPYASYPTGRDPISLDLGDLDRDGIVDVVTGNRELNGFGTPGSVSTLFGAGDGSFARRQTLAAGGGNFAAVHWVQVHDLDDDGALEIVALAYASPGASLAVFQELGPGVFGPRANYALVDEPQDFDIGDVDRDLVPDIVVSSFSRRRVEVLFGRGDGSFAPRVNFPAQSYGAAVVVADMDGDGMPDANVIDGLFDTVRVLRNEVLP